MAVAESIFGKVNEEDAKAYKITNKSGNYIEVISFGAIIKNICIKDKIGKVTDLVLGYDNIEGYLDNPCFFGGTIGPNANRVDKGEFTVNGKKVQINKNENGIKNLHSGPCGFEKQLFKLVKKGEDYVELEFTSKENYNGFPGKFTLKVKFSFNDNNELRIDYFGTCTEDTIANCTNHSYFNLNGHKGNKVNNIKLKFNSSAFVPVKDENAIPTGKHEAVEKTPFDFREEKEIGKDISSSFKQIIYGNGYDHSLVIDNFKENELNYLGYGLSENTGIKMEIYTTCPCFQFYTGNYISNIQGKDGAIYNERQGFCIETGAEPNAINEESFYDTALLKGEKYISSTIYKFVV